MGRGLLMWFVDVEVHQHVVKKLLCTAHVCCLHKQGRWLIFCFSEVNLEGDLFSSTGLG